MNFKVIYGLLVIFSFAFGGYLWKVSKRLQNNADFVGEADNEETINTPTAVDIVIVGTKPITVAELDWEYNLHTSGLDETDELTPIPEMGNKYGEKLEPLKQMLLAGIIERRLLYQFIKAETQFDTENPARYTKCLRDWQELLATAPKVVTGKSGAERLKARLCENSVIKQYLKEKVFNEVDVDDAKARQYFEKNLNLFQHPMRVTIRHIVTASEKDARTIRYKLKSDNFASYAKKYSIAPEAAKGGLLGPFAKGEMPAVFDVAFSMRRGEIRGVLKSTYGFHIFYLKEKHRKRNPAFKEAKSEVYRLFREEEQERLYQDLLETALNSIEVKPPKPLW